RDDRHRGVRPRPASPAPRRLHGSPRLHRSGSGALLRASFEGGWSMTPFLSVVAPCFNEQESLPEFHRRVSAACRDLGLPYEIVGVKDGSRDGTWARLREIAACDPHVVAVDLMRNHGHQLALTAGLDVCRGERILVLDADLQDPPELLPDMMRLM